jgi:hypothetical protein
MQQTGFYIDLKEIREGFFLIFFLVKFIGERVQPKQKPDRNSCS